MCPVAISHDADFWPGVGIIFAQSDFLPLSSAASEPAKRAEGAHSGSKELKSAENEFTFENFSEQSAKPWTMDAQRGNSLHCTAENSLPLPNF